MIILYAYIGMIILTGSASVIAYYAMRLEQLPVSWRVTIARALGYHRCRATHPYVAERCIRVDGHDGLHRIDIWSWHDVLPPAVPFTAPHRHGRR